MMSSCPKRSTVPATSSAMVSSLSRSPAKVKISVPVAPRISSAARSRSDAVRGAHRHPHSLLCQHLRARASQPFAGAAHNRYLAVQFQVHYQTGLLNCCRRL